MIIEVLKKNYIYLIFLFILIILLVLNNKFNIKDIFVEKFEENMQEDVYLSLEHMDTNSFGNRYHLYVNVPEGSRIDAVYGDEDNPLSIEGALYQHDVGSVTSVGINEALLRIPDYSDLNYDSWVTIGKENGTDNELKDVNIDFGENGIETTNGSWFVTADDEQGREINGKVLIGQFTLIEGELNVSVNVQGSYSNGDKLNRTGLTISARTDLTISTRTQPPSSSDRIIISLIDNINTNKDNFNINNDINELEYDIITETQEIKDVKLTIVSENTDSDRKPENLLIDEIKNIISVSENVDKNNIRISKADWIFIENFINFNNNLYEHFWQSNDGVWKYVIEYTIVGGPATTSAPSFGFSNLESNWKEHTWNNVYAGNTYLDGGYEYSASDCASFCANNDECGGYAVIPETAQGLSDNDTKNNKCVLLTYNK